MKKSNRTGSAIGGANREQIRLLKEQLREQVREQELLIDSRLTFCRENVGSIVVHSAVDSVKSYLPNFVQVLLASFLEPHRQKKEEGEEDVAQDAALKQESATDGPGLSGALLSVVVDVVRPILIGAIIRFLKKKVVK